MPGTCGPQGVCARPCWLRDAIPKDSSSRKEISGASSKKTRKENTEMFPLKGARADGKRVYINEISGY